MNKIFQQIAFNRAFELEIENQVNKGNIKVPVYLSLGTEHIPAHIINGLKNWQIFPQHRCHSWYLSSGGSPVLLAKELLSMKDGLGGGMVGSPSLFNEDMFGHSGLLGDNLSIAAGFCHATQKNTIAVLGDGAIEEDYAIATLGYISTYQLPILIIIEDNDLSILTKKKTRRNWDAVDLSKGFGLKTLDIVDKDISKVDYKYIKENLPYVLQIKCQRHGFHVGAGRDSLPEWNYYEEFKNSLPSNLGSLIELEETQRVKDIWIKAQQTQ